MELEMPKLETMLRRDGEDAATFAGRVDDHVAVRATEGWYLQTERANVAVDDESRSVDLVFLHAPVR